MSTKPNPVAWYQFVDGKVYIDYYGDTFLCEDDEVVGLIEYLNNTQEEK